MGAEPEKPRVSFEIDVEVRYADALLGAMTQFTRRSRTLLWGYGTVVAGFAVAGWISGSSAIWWGVLVMAIVGALPPMLMTWLTWRDYRARGGKALRMRYHVCESGVEVRAAGRVDWLTWEDVWQAGETRSSFLLSPTPYEQYVIPKRCCGERVVAQLRNVLRSVASHAARG